MLDPKDIVDEATLKQALKEREERLVVIQNRPRPRPFRYVVAVELQPVTAPTGVGGDNSTQFPPARGSQTVKNGTLFRCEAMDFTYSVTGTSAATGLAVNAVIGATARSNIILARFKARDTGSDREWSNNWVPVDALLTANENAFEFGRGRGVASGGSQIVVDVDAIFIATPGRLITAGLSAITKHMLRFGFIGKEVQA